MNSARGRLWLVIAFAALAMVLGQQGAYAGGSVHSSHSSAHSSTHTSGGHSSGGHYRPGHYHNYNGLTAGMSGSYYSAGQPAATGSQFSGPAHIDPSQYHYFVQEYQWPASTKVN